MVVFVLKFVVPVVFIVVKPGNHNQQVFVFIIPCLDRCTVIKERQFQIIADPDTPEVRDF